MRKGPQEIAVTQFSDPVLGEEKDELPLLSPLPRACDGDEVVIVVIVAVAPKSHVLTGKRERQFSWEVLMFWFFHS